MGQETSTHAPSNKKGACKFYIHMVANHSLILLVLVANHSLVISKQGLAVVCTAWHWAKPMKIC